MNAKFKSSRFRSIFKTVLLFLLMSAQFSCTTHRSPEEKLLFEAADALDDLAKIHEEYGTAVMSYPQLSLLKDSHNFDLDRKSEDYFNEAKTLTQGGAGHALMVANALTGSAQVKNNPMISMQYQSNQQQYSQYQAAAGQFNAKQQEICDVLKSQWLSEQDQTLQAEKLTKYESCLEKLKPSAVNPPTLDTTQPGEPQTPKNADEAKALLKDGILNPTVGSLVSGVTPSITNREAISIAAGDKAVETVYRLLGNAETALQYKDKVLLVGVSTVSVNPGWRTREDFSAKLEAQLLIKYENAREYVKKKFITKIKDEQLGNEFLLRDCSVSQFVNCVSTLPAEYKCKDKDSCSSGINPLVAAVSPLTDTQTLDLSNSERKVMEFSLALAGILKDINMEAQASIMEQFVRSNQRDAKTRTANIVTNSYSINGGAFGYQIVPKFVGLNVQGNEDDSANVLQQQSFPVLLLIGLDRLNLNPRVVCDPPNGNENCELFEPQLVMEQSSDWLKWNDHWYYAFNDPGLYPSDYIKANLALNKANSAFQSVPLSEVLKKSDKLLNLKTTLKKYPVASDSHQNFPIDVIFPEHEKNPTITEILPNQITIKRKNGKITPKNVDLLIRGNGLQHTIDINKTVVQGDLSKTTAKILSDSEIKVSTTITGNSPIYVKLPLKNDPGHYLFSAPVTVEVVDVKSP